MTKNTLWVGYSSTFFFSAKSGLDNLEKMYQNTPYEKITQIYDYINANSEAKIVFGGAYALISHADPQVDYYIAGYGDVSTVDLTNYLAGKKDSLETREKKKLKRIGKIIHLILGITEKRIESIKKELNQHLINLQK